MSATRLLILGAMQFLQPTHGYEVRRELESWNAAHWANIAYGSIYFALRKLAAEGFLEVVSEEKTGKRPARIVYRMTETGDQEFMRLLREVWSDFKSPADPFVQAFSFMHRLPREEILAGLQQRATAINLNLRVVQNPNEPDPDDYKPPHVYQLQKLFFARSQAELDWLAETIGMVERGELQ